MQGAAKVSAIIPAYGAGFSATMHMGVRKEMVRDCIQDVHFKLDHLSGE